LASRRSVFWKVGPAITTAPIRLPRVLATRQPGC